VSWYDSMDNLPSGSDGSWHRVERSGGSPYILVGIPLQNSLGVVVAHAEGVFAVSPETVRIVRFRAVKIGLAVMLIVLVTTAILYPIIMTLMRRMAVLSLNLFDSHLEMLKVLGSAIAQKDSDTDAHNYRVTIMSVRLAEELDLPDKEIQTLVKGAFLHDVGKIGIPDKILLKPGKLDEEEFTVMKAHVDHGVKIVEKSRWLEDALKVVEYHHEKISGEGYPHRFGQEEIPIFARIFAIADVFDALTSRRPYKEPFPFDESMSMMEEGRGSHFDPVVFDTFKGIARSLYDDLSGEEEKPKELLEEIIEKYFGADATVLEI
jgi:HD-GYP domain-containing protein (c-di-GMP phosphodiesterase class II)